MPYHEDEVLAYTAAVAGELAPQPQCRSLWAVGLGVVNADAAATYSYGRQRTTCCLTAVRLGLVCVRGRENAGAIRLRSCLERGVGSRDLPW